ncbi:hypothetical protein Tsubulata_007237, partial [Turnera subulata]
MFNEAWTLFCMKAFPWNAKRCPQELEDLAKDVVEKCKGLPLAVVSLGGLFSTKRSELEWKTTCNGLNRELSNSSMVQPIKSILLLCCNDLPYRLKHCFQRKRLVRLWMAEGFIEKVREWTPEEIANRYLMYLIPRSLLQVVEIDIYGLPGTCKMHDMLREFASSKSEEEKFCALYEDRIGGRREEGIRHLSIQESQEQIKPWEGMTQLRSFLLFGSGTIDSTMINKLLSGFKLWRVLDLRGAHIDTFPDHIVILFNLTYLNLKRTRIKKLPESIGSMAQLVRLYITNNEVSDEEDLCIAIQNMPLLRRLSVWTNKKEQILRLDALKSPPPFLEKLTLSGKLENIPHWFRMLKEVPSGINCLTKLQELALASLAADVLKRIEEASGVDRPN